MQVKVVQIVSTIEREAAGPTYSVRKMCEALAESNVDVTLHVLAKTKQTGQHRRYNVEAHQAWSFPGALGISPGMRRRLKIEAQVADIFHNNLLWMMPNYYAGTIVHQRKARLITSPRGALAPWAWQRSRWKKAIFWHLGQKDALLNAACLHATAQNEYQDIRRMGFNTPVALIPNGVDIPEYVVRSARNGQKKRLLFLGRIHPVKGVDMLLRVWSSMERRFPEWELAIYGPDEGGYLREMKLLASELSLERVKFGEAVYGDEKSKIYSSADLYILPTHTENFGLTVAEALAHGVPCIVTKGAPWNGMQEHHCGWWVDRTENVLRDALSEAMACTSHELQEMGARGRQWMKDEFSWQGIGEKMLITYQWLLDGGSVPDWVRES